MLTENGYGNLDRQLPVDAALSLFAAAGLVGGRTYETPPIPGKTWPRSAWTAGQYRTLLADLAHTHARWWGTPTGPAGYPLPCVLSWDYMGRGVEEARAALLRIESASWGEKFFTREELRAWLRVLDDPACLLEILAEMPQTLIQGEGWLDDTAPGGGYPGQTALIGPAPYDLACLYSSCRWRFGRLPLSLTDMRNHYLRHLNERLGQRVDRYFFDAGFDAARAWRFALLWPGVILEQNKCLLGCLRHLRAGVIEPSFASLRRSGLGF